MIYNTQPPIISRDHDGIWWVITEYHAEPDGSLMVDDKWDVTERIEEIVESAVLGSLSPVARRN